MLLGELYKLTVEAFDRGIMVEKDQDARAARIRERAVARAPEPARGDMERFLQEVPDRYLLATPETDIPRHFDLVVQLERGDDLFASQIQHFPEREFSEFTVVTRNRPGLFAKLTGVLRAKGLSVVGAHATTVGDGLAIEVFRVAHADDSDVAPGPDASDVATAESSTTDQ